MHDQADHVRNHAPPAPIDREIAQDIAAENLFAFTAADALFQSMNDVELQFLLDSLPLINAFAGSDCGGPCYPFSYYVGHGCFAYVSYTTVSDIGGDYDMPSTGITCAGGQGGGGGGNPYIREIAREAGGAGFND